MHTVHLCIIIIIQNKMASNVDVTIREQESDSCLEQASKIVSSKILPISKWLLYVTANIAPREISLLKLCLHPTLVRNTSEASTASDLFHAMDASDNLKQHVQQAVLYKFICALRVIGCKRRGEECIAELERMEIKIPEASEHEESDEFLFFQCFTRVARDIESDDDARDKIKKAFSRRLDKNHHHYDHCAIADLFTDIYNAGLVRPDDCQEFLQVLNRCKNHSKYSFIMGKCKVESTYNRFACEIVTVIVRTIFTATIKMRNCYNNLLCINISFTATMLFNECYSW